MKNTIRTILVVVAFVAITFGLLAILWGDRCQEKKISAITSPDGQYKAVTLEKNCGPAIRVATLINVVKPAEDDEVTVLLYQGRDQVDLEWDGNENLRLSYPESTVIVKRRPKWGPLKVQFDVTKAAASNKESKTEG